MPVDGFEQEPSIEPPRMGGDILGEVARVADESALSETRFIQDMIARQRRVLEQEISEINSPDITTPKHKLYGELAHVNRLLGQKDVLDAITKALEEKDKHQST